MYIYDAEIYVYSCLFINYWFACFNNHNTNVCHEIIQIVIIWTRSIVYILLDCLKSEVVSSLLYHYSNIVPQHNTPLTTRAVAVKMLKFLYVTVSLILGIDVVSLKFKKQIIMSRHYRHYYFKELSNIVKNK